MNSFTSVFRYKEARVVVAICAFLVGLELFFGFAGRSLSEDVRNIEKISENAEKLAEAGAPRVLFLGNSILNAGIDPDRFKEQVKARGAESDIYVSMAYPDSSSVDIWDYLLRRYFAEPGRLPEDVVLVTGKRHLFDSRVDPIAMGAYYVSNRDMFNYLKEDAGGYEDGCAFFLGRYSATVRSRKRVAPRVFDAVLPYYQENWNLLNRARARGEEREASQSDPEREEGMRHLEGLLELLSEGGVRVTVVVAPGIKPYSIDTELVDLLERKGARLVDLNEIEGLDENGFSDPDHVNQEGRKLFTDSLAAELAGYWRK